MNEGILSGLRVLDFTWMLAGPYATRILADFGAEVIKVQSKKTSRGGESSLTGYFNTWNRNKRSITLDMSYPESKEIVLKLIAISDVLIENFSSRVMPNWGLNYEKLKEVRPNLIMVGISGMGHTGPWRDFVLFAPTIHALSGLTYLTSFSEDLPIGLGFSYADIVAGLYAALAILAALEYRDRTGRGQYIDISEYEATCTLLGPTLLDASVNHREVYPQGNHPDYISAAPHGCYKCLGVDRWCVIAVWNEEEWQALCNVLGHPDWIKEDKFSTLLKRKKNAEELDELLGEWTGKRAAEEVVQLFQEAGVPAGVIQNAEDLAKDPHLKARNFFVSLDHPILGRTFSDGSPIKFQNGSESKWKAAPLLGDDNKYVYIELLGLKKREFATYVEKGIIG